MPYTITCRQASVEPFGNLPASITHDESPVVTTTDTQEVPDTHGEQKEQDKGHENTHETATEGTWAEEEMAATAYWDIQPYTDYGMEILEKAAAAATAVAAEKSIYKAQRKRVRTDACTHAYIHT